MIDEKKWEKALIEFSADASIGRLFRGLIHNLNGVGQAFSMQAELLSVMFQQAETTLRSIEETDSLVEARESAASLKDMMAKRSGLTPHLLKEVQVLFDIMRRCSSVMQECRDPGSIHAYKLRDVIRSEVEFQSADSFFKHKVTKELVLDEDIPAFSCHQVTLHNILSILIENGSQAMEKEIRPKGDTPRLVISSSRNESTIRVDVRDNGPGIDENIELALFKPFISGSGRLGLGLYLAKTMADEFKGVISYESRPGNTCFTLMFPLAEVSVEV